MLVPAVKTGRCANGFERDKGRVVHLAEVFCCGSPSWRPALCGAKPGRLSAGWSELPLAYRVTCKRCRAAWAAQKG